MSTAKTKKPAKPARRAPRPGSRRLMIHNLLVQAGWPERQIAENYELQNRLEPPAIARLHHHGSRDDLVAYVLFAKPGTPTVAITTIGSQHDPRKSLARLTRQVSLLDVPLGYATNGRETVEYHRLSRRVAVSETITTPLRAWRAYQRAHGLDQEATHMVAQDYDHRLIDGDQADQRLRYYQVVAINRALGAVTKPGHRALLSLPAGTGTTLSSMALVSKVVNSRLHYQASEPYGIVYADGRTEFETPYGPVGTSRNWGRDDQIALTIGSLADQARLPKPADVQLLVLNLAHQGEEIDEGLWRKLAERYSGALQIGIIGAEPRLSTAIDDYFGLPVYRYPVRRAQADRYLLALQQPVDDPAADAPAEVGLVDEDWSQLEQPGPARAEHLERLVRIVGVVRLTASPGRHHPEWVDLEDEERALARRIWLLLRLAERKSPHGYKAKRQAEWLVGLEAAARARDLQGGEEALKDHIALLRTVLDSARVS
jgi:hypothetical protein